MVCVLVLFSGALSLSAPVVAQDYQNTARWNGIDYAIEYLDADDPVPTVEDISRRDTTPSELPVVEDGADVESAEGRAQRQSSPLGFTVPSELFVVISVLIILAVAIAALRFGGLGGIGRATEISGRQVDLPEEFQTSPEMLNDPDPTAALIALNRAALVAAAQVARLTIRRGWTARDVLMRLPEDLPHRAPLDALAERAEAAQFAGVSVRSMTLRHHKASIAPLLAETAS